MDIISFIHRTCEHLVSPSISFFPIPERKQINLHLIVIRDRPVYEGRPNVVDWDSIQSRLRSIPLLPGQKLTFKRSELLFAECLDCAIAKSNSVKVRHSFRILDLLLIGVHHDSFYS